MLKGKRFSLKAPTLGMLSLDGHRIPVTIPSGAMLAIVSEHFDGNQMVDILWAGKTVMMFALDVKERGEEITDDTPKGSAHDRN